MQKLCLLTFLPWSNRKKDVCRAYALHTSFFRNSSPSQMQVFCLPSFQLGAKLNHYLCLHQ
jgi:hypothetical protein